LWHIHKLGLKFVTDQYRSPKRRGMGKVKESDSVDLGLHTPTPVSRVPHIRRIQMLILIGCISDLHCHVRLACRVKYFGWSPSRMCGLSSMDSAGISTCLTGMQP
jgi:hypothetical protein